MLQGHQTHIPIEDSLDLLLICWFLEENELLFLYQVDWQNISAEIYCISLTAPKYGTKYSHENK